LVFPLPCPSYEGRSPWYTERRPPLRSRPTGASVAKVRRRRGGLERPAGRPVTGEDGGNRRVRYARGVLARAPDTRRTKGIDRQT
jgi:hypothetical protein